MKAWFAELAYECYKSFALIANHVLGIWVLMLLLPVIGG